jgi:hypothetical protein
MTIARPAHFLARAIASLVFAAALLEPSGARAVFAQTPKDVTVKAALLYNFAKFAEWSALVPGAPIVVCIVGNEPIAEAFVAAVRGQQISGHPLNLKRPPDSTTWPSCQLLFIGEARFRESSSGLVGIKAAPVLTVSDSAGFARSGGIIELYIENGQMRFVINLDAVERSGLQLSSRLLGLAKVIRDPTNE